MSTVYSQPDSVGEISSISQNTQKPCIFYCEMKNPGTLIPILKSICVKRMTEMVVTERGMKITCEKENRVVQANVFIERESFTKYEMHECSVPATLHFQMSDLILALSSLFNSKEQSLFDRNRDDSLLKIKFQDRGRLKLQVTNGNQSSKAYIQTFIPPEKLIVFSFSFVNKITIDSAALIQFWKSADKHSKRIRLKILNSEPWFVLGTDSFLGKFSFRCAADSPYIEHYECTVPMEEQYEMTGMRFTVRPLMLASKLSIRTDSNGLLCMQFIIGEHQNPHILDRDSESRQELADHLANMPPPGVARSIITSTEKNYVIEFYIVPCIIE